MNNRFLQFCILILTLVAVLLWKIIAQWPEGQLKLIFCDVGQGDAILIVDGTTQMLVDGGRDDRVIDCLLKHMPFWDKTIELVVATHADSDHIGGLTLVLKRFGVQRLLVGNQTKQTDDFEEFERVVSALEATNSKLIIRPKINDQITVSKRVTGRVLWPDVETDVEMGSKNQTTETTLSDSFIKNNRENYGKLDHNNRSIVLFVTLDSVGVLLTGDLEQPGETALIALDLIHDVDILKVGHHGSKSGSTTQFLKISRPEKSVISVGENNQYYHPTPEVISRLHGAGSDILRTDILGTIVFDITGSSYQLR